MDHIEEANLFPPVCLCGSPDCHEYLVERCKKYLASKGCTLWADFTVDSDRGQTVAGEWLASQMEGVLRLGSAPHATLDTPPAQLA